MECQRCFDPSPGSMQPARAYTICIEENQKYHETACISLTSAHISLLAKFFFKHCKEKKKEKQIDIPFHVKLPCDMSQTVSKHFTFLVDVQSHFLISLPLVTSKRKQL